MDAIILIDAILANEYKEEYINKLQVSETSKNKLEMLNYLCVSMILYIREDCILFLNNSN